VLNLLPRGNIFYHHRTLSNVFQLMFSGGRCTSFPASFLRVMTAMRRRRRSGGARFLSYYQPACVCFAVM
jgi:heme/copper-type cytochrome/quinol oxidase subunit 1